MKTKLGTFQSPVKAFSDYYHSLPWHSFLEKRRLKSLIDESVVLDEIDASMDRLNNVNVLTLNAYLNSLLQKKRKLLTDLARIVNNKNKNYKMVLNTQDPSDTQFTITAKRGDHHSSTTYTDETNPVELTALLRQLNLQELKQASQIVFTINQINHTLTRGVSKQNREAMHRREINIANHGSTTGLLNEIDQNDADSIAFERVNLASDDEPFRAGKYHYLYASDHWTIEESAIIFRVIAHAIREAKIVISFNLQQYLALNPAAVEINENAQRFVQINDNKFPIKSVSGVDYVDVPLSITEAFNAPNEKDNHGLYTPIEEYRRTHFTQLKKLVAKLDFRFTVDERNPLGPRKIELHSGILKENANRAGLTWLDITDSVARNGGVPSETFVQNNVDATKLAKITDVRNEVFALQNSLESPGYGRDNNGCAFPINNGAALKNYIKAGLKRRVSGTDAELDGYLNRINFNQIDNFDNFVTQQFEMATAARPGFWNFLSSDSDANIRKHAVLTALAEELKAVQDYRARLTQKVKPQDEDDLNLNEGFRNDLLAAEQLFTVKHPYNRFTLVDNKQLLGLAYESQKQIERYDKFKEELESYKPGNWFTRWWRSGALKLVNEKEQALGKAKAELDKYREGLAEEMFVRINKFVLTDEMTQKVNEEYSLLGEYKAFIEMYGSVATQSKLVMRTNYRAHLTSLLSKGLNEENRVTITKYINELIQNAAGNAVELNFLTVLKKILLGEAFDVAAELDEHKIECIKQYFDPNRNKAEPRLDDQVKQAQADQLYKSCFAFDRHLRQAQHNNQRGGYDNSTLFSYFAKEFGGSNLKRIFTHAETQKQLISSQSEKAKVVTYTQLIDKFCDDSNHASEVLKGYRNLAVENLKYFESLLIQGKHPATTQKLGFADRLDQGVIRVKYIPIAVLPLQTRPTVVYGYDIQLTDKKTLFLGNQPLIAVKRENVNNYIHTLYSAGIYKGEHFALDNVMAVIGNADEKGRYVEKRLAKIFSNPDYVIRQNNQVIFKFTMNDLAREKDFVNQFRGEVQSHVDNAIKYLYYTHGWNITTQTIVDQLASTALQEEVRLDRLESLLSRAANNGNDFLDDIEQGFLLNLVHRGITANNFATGERLNRYKSIIEKYLARQYKPNALLEEVIFKYTNSTEYRDNFVIKEVEFNVAQNDEARIHLFHYKWAKRIDAKDPVYTAHLPKAYNSNDWQNNSAVDVKSESYVGCPIVTQISQQRYDAAILNALFVNGVVTQDNAYKSRYNPNYQLLVEFANRSVQRELNMQLISEHLADPNNENAHWRYLPIAPIDDVSREDQNKLTDEQKVRYGHYKSVENNAKTLYETVRSRKKERGFGEEVIGKTDVTSKHKEEYNFYQGFTRHYDETKSALTALYGSHTAQRMLEMYGFEDIEKLVNCVGETRLLQLAKIVDKALTRVENSLNPRPPVSHAEQVTWVSTFIITDAFVKRINQQLLAIEQASKRNDSEKESHVNEQLHKQLRDLKTRLNTLKPIIEAAHKSDVDKRQAIQFIEHQNIARLFDEVILRIIGEMRVTVGFLSVTTNEKLTAEYVAEINSKQKLLKELFGLLVDYAKSFRHDEKYKQLFAQLKTEFQRARSEEPVIRNTDKPEVQLEMQKVDALWKAAENDIFANELSLQNTADKVRTFKAEISTLLKSSDKQIIQSQFRTALINALSKENLILVRFFNEQELKDLQSMAEAFVNKVKECAELKILATAFLNILKGSKEQNDVNAIAQFNLFNEIMKFALEGKPVNVALFTIENLTALRDGPYGLGKINSWNITVNAILDRYLADPSADLTMLNVCDIVVDRAQQAQVQAQTNAIRKARSFIDKAFNRQGFELKGDFEIARNIAEIRADSQLQKVLTDSYIHYQKEIAETVKTYHARFSNIAVCKNNLENYLNVNIVENKCNDNNEQLNKHIEFISNLYIHVQLHPQGDNKSIDVAFKRFIEQFVAAINHRPAQAIPCGTAFAKGVINKLATTKDVQMVKEACDKYHKTIVDSEASAKSLAHKIKSEFNNRVDYFKAQRGASAEAIRMLIENFAELISKLDKIDDNFNARNVFISEFNKTQPFRVKLNTEVINANNSSFKDAIRKAVDALVMSEINSIPVKAAADSPAPAAANANNRHSPSMSLNLGE